MRWVLHCCSGGSGNARTCARRKFVSGSSRMEGQIGWEGRAKGARNRNNSYNLELTAEFLSVRTRGSARRVADLWRLEPRRQLRRFCGRSCAIDRLSAICGAEGQRASIDAEALAARGGSCANKEKTIREHIAEVASAGSAADLRASNGSEQRVVLRHLDCGQRRRERGPSGARIELGVAAEEG